MNIQTGSGGLSRFAWLRGIPPSLKLRRTSRPPATLWQAVGLLGIKVEDALVRIVCRENEYFEVERQAGVAAG
jgi:hypothetical protein